MSVMKTSNGNSKEKFQVFPGVKFEHLLAGVSGGVVSTLLLHPLDLMKIRFAVSDVHGSSGAAATRPHYKGLISAMSHVMKTEGVKGLYRGVTANVFGAASAWGLYFLFYNSAKSRLQGGDSKLHLGPVLHLLAATEAGVLSLIATNPIWVVKTRLCLQFGAPSTVAVGESQHYKGILDAFRKTYKYEGIRGLYKGFSPGVIGVSHGSIQFMTYEELKARYNIYRSLPTDAKLNSMEYLGCAALSKFFAAVTTYPYQVLRARMQDQHCHYKSMRHCIKETWSANGLRGFYRGLAPYCIRVVPATTITFVVYENIIIALS